MVCTLGRDKASSAERSFPSLQPLSCTQRVSLFPDLKRANMTRASLLGLSQVLTKWGMSSHSQLGTTCV